MEEEKSDWLAFLCMPCYFVSLTSSHIMSQEAVDPLQVPSLSELKIMTDTEQRAQIVVTLAFFKLPTQLLSFHKAQFHCSRIR